MVKNMGINYEELWTEFKQWIVSYEAGHITPSRFDGERYCVAISCRDLVEKMDEMESKKK